MNAATCRCWGNRLQIGRRTALFRLLSPVKRDMIIRRSSSCIMVRPAVLFSALLIACPAAHTQDSAPPPVPPATSTVSPEIKEFQTIEDKWSIALNERDQYGLEL